LGKGDPTDNALAAIASILDKPGSVRPPEKQAVEPQSAAPAASPSIEADGYCKTGPGPMESIRFKWTARRDSRGDFYVDETIGDHSAPIVSGPMSREAAIKFVDDREKEARQRFENIRNEMTGGDAAADLSRKGGG